MIQFGIDLRQVTQRDFWTSRGHQPGLLPEHDVVVVAVPGVAGRQGHHPFGGVVGRRGQLETELLTGHQRHHWFHPCRRTTGFADMTHAGEAPQGLLPAANIRREGRNVGGGGRFPAGAQRIQQRRGLGSGEGVAKQAQVLRAQSGAPRDLGDRGSAGVAKFEAGQQVPVERHPATLVGLEDDALEIHRVAALGIGEAPVETADFGEQFLGPVATGGLGGEPDAVGQ